jgi:hypothetical protein
MSHSSAPLRQFVKQALVAAAHTPSPSPAQLAAAFDRLSNCLRARLQSVFGATAVNALFARAVHLAAGEFPWLTEILPKGAPRAAAARLQTVATHVDSASLQDGLVAVLAHDIGLLNEFIGDDFVLPLVQQVWSGTVSPQRSVGPESDV